jgi:hypothetical protein
MKFFIGAIHHDGGQKAAIVVAKTQGEAAAMLKAIGWRYSESHLRTMLRTYWHMTDPKVCDNLSVDAKPGVYVAESMNYPRHYKLRKPS